MSQDSRVHKGYHVPDKLNAQAGSELLKASPHVNLETLDNSDFEYS